MVSHKNRVWPILLGCAHSPAFCPASAYPEALGSTPKTGLRVLLPLLLPCGATLNREQSQPVSRQQVADPGLWDLAKVRLWPRTLMPILTEVRDQDSEG